LPLDVSGGILQEELEKRNI
jgi:hypothetical protein